MLELHLVDGDSPNLGELNAESRVAQFELEEIETLGKWGVLPERVSYFEDTHISQPLIAACLRLLRIKKAELKMTPGFKSRALDTLEHALDSAQRQRKSLMCVCD